MGNKVAVCFVSMESVLRMFRVDRVVAGGSKYAGVHGVFVRRFIPGSVNPCSAVLVAVENPLRLVYSNCEVKISCQFEHVNEDGHVV